jgi:hypothetical protein
MLCVCLSFVLFTVLSCECIFQCDLSCLMFIDMFYIQMQLMQRLDQWNDYVYIYIYVYVYIISRVYLVSTTNPVWVEVQEYINARDIKVSLYYRHKWYSAIYYLCFFILLFQYMYIFTDGSKGESRIICIVLK